MIRTLISFGKWLESRFPEKVVVTQHDYNELNRRLLLVEEAAVHKEAVQALIKIIEEMKIEQNSFKASMGFVSKPVNEDIAAMLNGSFLSAENR